MDRQQGWQEEQDVLSTSWGYSGSFLQPHLRANWRQGWSVAESFFAEPPGTKELCLPTVLFRFSPRERFFFSFNDFFWLNDFKGIFGDDFVLPVRTRPGQSDFEHVSFSIPSHLLRLPV